MSWEYGFNYLMGLLAVCGVGVMSWIVTLLLSIRDRMTRLETRLEEHDYRKLRDRLEDIERACANCVGRRGER